MTPQQLEAATRAYCLAKGIDPDEVLDVSGPPHKLTQVRWESLKHHVEGKILDRLSVNAAIDAALRIAESGR